MVQPDHVAGVSLAQRTYPGGHAVPALADARGRIINAILAGGSRASRLEPELGAHLLELGIEAAVKQVPRATAQ